MMAEKIMRRRYIFKGYVQGVGFRYTAKHAADMYGLTGWVKNLYNGNVEMEIQGTADEISEVIKRIMNGRYIEVTDMNVKEIPLVEDERSFGIR